MSTKHQADPFDVGFNAIQIAGGMENPCQVNTSELIATAAIAMAEVEADPTLGWDGEFDTAIDEITHLLETDAPSVHVLNTNPAEHEQFLERIREITRKNMVPIKPEQPV